MPDPDAEPPHPYHLLKMAKRVNYKSDDPTAVETFDDEYKPRA
jgi:hypothetical protein